jgi:uncharacterized membrane protein
MGRSKRSELEDSIALAIIVLVLFGVVLLLTYPQRNWNESFLCKALGFIGAAIAVLATGYLIIADAAERQNGFIALGVGVIAYAVSFFVAEWIPDAEA